MSAAPKRRHNVPPQHNGARLLKILRANLARTSDPMLRQRLEAAIASIKARKPAA